MHSHDYDNLVEAQQGLLKQGYTEEFLWKDGKMMSADRSKTYRPSDLKMVEHYRFEGMTNPADMSIVMVVEASDGKKGYVVSGYGTYADPKLDEFMDEVPEVEDTEVDKAP